MPDLTLGQALERIEAELTDVARQLALMQAAEWSTRRGHALCNREQELHAAVMVLRELGAKTSPLATTVAASR